MYVGDEKERLTLEAMQRGEPLIYSGRMQAEGLLGDPDLLRREGDRYVAGDIKSGAGEEGLQDLSKPKKHYAVQLGLYTDILERKGLSAGKRGFIWDINGQEVVYDFTEPHGKGNPRTRPWCPAARLPGTAAEDLDEDNEHWANCLHCQQEISARNGVEWRRENARPSWSAGRVTWTSSRTK